MSSSPNPLVAFLRQRGLSLSPLWILTHDHPDPDALASAWALSVLAERVGGIKSRIVYGGVIGRMENQMLMRVLHLPARPLKGQELARAEHVALVDTQPPFQNNQFRKPGRARLVVDHHRRHARTKADFTLIDEAAGATATLLTEALLAAGVEIPARVATALVYAIASETQHFGRQTDARDISAYRALSPRASVRLLAKIEHPPRPDSFFLTLGRAIRDAFMAGRVIGVHLGAVPSQDVISHMADFLLSHEKAQWSLVTGRYGGRLYVSVRTRNPRAEAGRLLWRLLGSGTSAGGHRMIAGGAIIVGDAPTESQWQTVEQELTTRFLQRQGHKAPGALQYPYHQAAG